MTLTTEILIFEASDGFRNDPGLVIPAFDVALKAKGVQSPVYYGKQIEEPSTWGYLILNWDEYESHKALIDGPTYPDVIAGLKSSIGGSARTEMYHVKFASPTIALEMPVTEVAILSLKAPENRAALVDILTKLSEASEKRFVFGQTREDENKYVLIAGWPTVEAHQEISAKPEVAAAREKLLSLANKEHAYHTKLLQYPKL
ncbi:hypothetical protein L210DRAFT_3564460 [Boletus edulis BED1]|uniref:ABM domain-containing protein n=1 Tax=Boletus edulis BED1 TaxID=1328754 RepID=A0AAD4G904_BOLED|nr:hypothetical protein L210DRAFT_3564460 [Boletus edulis BED1]